jgi:polyisoprenoid-binding protein YceI
MKHSKLLIVALIVLIGYAFCFVKPLTWKVKDNYSITTGSGADGKGISFKGLKATINFDEEDASKSFVNAFIDANSLNAGNSEMTEHAKEAIDAKKFPLITFRSTSIVKTKTGYEATGDLTLKGVTKEIKFPFDFDSKKDIIKFPFVPKETFSARMTIIPKDFGVVRPGTPDKLFIDIIVPVTK